MGITALLDELNRLVDSTENLRRLSLWEEPERAIRGEGQWHAVPNYTVADGRAMPVTVECLDKIWEQTLGLRIERYFTDPDYFLEYYLRIRLEKFKRFPDDTPLSRDIPVSFGVTHEAGMLGQKIYFSHGEEPTFARQSVVEENTELPKRFDFDHNPYLDMVIPFYERVKRRAGREFNVIFPQWFRGPQGVALYIRGFENFSLDLYLNEALAHRVLRYVTDAAKAFVTWRAEYLDEPFAKGDLFNDDIALMSPETYRRFFLPYEQEMSDFYGGIHYWHSCGDITKHVPEVHRLTDIGLLDFGVTMEDKAEGMSGLNRPQVLELRVAAKSHIQEASQEEAGAYLRRILQACREAEIQKYVLRSSGMSVLLGAEQDLAMLRRWLELARQVQLELN